ncbi:MAG: phospho-N-acetylmuramoyl-pentapeptide-transferase [Candidatus Ancillula sp.]|nr:phospho-N-acetylmuramoyl-pentapeptide-transferase [Candidatus Ancillula sp.]
MIALLIATAVSLFLCLFLTPVFTKFLTKRQMGQFIRQDGPKSHLTKRGTPTMGGVIIIFSSVIGFTCGSLWMFFAQNRTVRPSSLLAMGLMVGMGLIGFIDDFAKISHQQNEGLTPRAKMILQTILGIIFAILSLQFADANGITPASTSISWTSDTFLDFGWFLQFGTIGSIICYVLFVIFINLIITAWTNAVNLTDGLDGLATGISIFAFASYVVICYWQFSQACTGNDDMSNCYMVRDPWDLALVAGAIMGALFGFLWWNASPAKIFMGDTGSLALGGAFASMSILTHTELLALIIGGVYLMEVMSDVIQVVHFKRTHKRVFKMAPIHHHFELIGWKEVNVVIRFWLIAGLCAAVGVGIFYTTWLV